MSNTVLMSTSFGLSGEQILPFLQSLIASNYGGTFVLFSDDLSFPQDAIANFPFSFIQEAYTNHGYPDLHGGVNRLFLYRDFLEKHDEFDKVITSGIRDVIFQENPDNIIPTGDINIYMEDEGTTIGGCQYNRKWIRDIYPECLNDLLNKHMICPEIICGSRDAFLKLTHAMIEEAKKKKECAYLVDMAILIKMYYGSELPYCTAIPNECSPVYTVGRVSKLHVKEHKIYNHSGYMPVMVHQYDRHIKHV